MNIIQNKSNGAILLLDTMKYRKPRLRKVPKKINWSRNKLERIFNPSKDEVLRSNNDKFVKWIMKVLRNTGQTLKSGQNYNSCCLYLSKNNLDKLHKLLDPMVWVNFSPAVSTGLSDSLLGIDLQDVVDKL